VRLVWYIRVCGSSMPSLNLWDSVRVSGIVQEYQNATEIDASSITVLGSGSPINPLIITVSDIAESLEGVLVRFEGKVSDHWINRYGDFKLKGNGGNVRVMNFSRYRYLAFWGIAWGSRV